MSVFSVMIIISCFAYLLSNLFALSKRCLSSKVFSNHDFLLAIRLSTSSFLICVPA